jgi:fatty acid-binding protein DegV
VIAMLDTLEYVRRSGRVSWARARISGLLRIKAFLEVKEGTVFSLGEARTRQKGIERLMELIHKLGPMERLALLHTNAEGDARKILSDLNPQLSTEPLLVNVTTAIGTHVGPNGLGIAAVISS